MEWKVLLNGEITGKLLLILLRIKYNLPIPMRGGEREREREKGGGYYRLPPVKPKRKTCQTWRGLENTALVRRKWTGVDDDLRTVVWCITSTKPLKANKRHRSPYFVLSSTLLAILQRAVYNLPG